MRRLRVAVLTHEDLVPPASIEGLSEKEIQPWKREWGVVDALKRLGHEVRVVGVSHDLAPIRETVRAWRPHVVFNLLMEFQDVGFYQVYVTSYLELLNVAYTGCNPRGLLVSRDKSVAKTLLRYHRIPTPAFAVFRKGRAVRPTQRFRYPLIVKSLDEEASLGIAQASIVRDAGQLRERVNFVQESVGTDAIAEEYVEGRELTVSVLGNRRLSTFPVWELFFENLPEGSEPIATARAKWDLAYQRRIGLETGRARDLSPEAERRIARLAKRLYRVLGLSGFARVDLRLGPEGRASVIEVNAAPDVTYDEDLALSAEAAGLAYEDLLRRILSLALRYEPLWKSV